MRQHIAHLCFACAWCVALPCAVAQDADSSEAIKIQEVVQRAAKSNPGLRQARLRLTQSEIRARGENSLLTPVLQLETSGLHEEEPVRGLLENGVRETDVIQINGSLSKRLPWGTNLSIALNQLRFRAVQPFELPGIGLREQVIGPNWQQNLVFTLNQPLWRGLGKDVNLSSVRATQAQVSVAQAQQRQATSQTLLEVLGTFFELAYAQEDVLIKARQIEFAQGQRDATVALIESGQLAPVEEDVINQRALVLEEAQLVGQHDVGQRQRQLSRALGEMGETLRAETDFETVLPAESLEDLLALALAQNPELLVLQEQKQTLRATLPAREDATDPQLDLTMAAGLNALSEEGLFDATGNLLGFDATRLFVGLVFSMPWDNQRAEAALQADRMDIQMLELQILELELELKAQVQDAYRLMLLGRKRVDLAQRGESLAKRALEAEQERFRRGRSTNQTVLQVQEEWERAQGRSLRSRVDLAQSVLQLRHLTGTLLETYGLEVAP